MRTFLIRRLLAAIPLIIAVTFITKAMLVLSPGNYLDTIKLNPNISPDYIAYMEKLYHLDSDNIFERYWFWLWPALRGDFGYSFTFQRDAGEIISQRLPMSMAISLGSVLFIWVVALPVGVFSAVKKYTLGDHIATFFGFIGLAVPNFLLALILMYLSYRYFGQALLGLFSSEYANAPWSVEKFFDLLKHLWIPIIILGTSGTAGLIRTMRANLLDELNKPYVDTARAKGLRERVLLWKYPVRHALNPFISTIGWVLPSLVAGEVIVSIVLNLPTSGPVLFNALLSQDMYVASGFILVLSTLTVIGTFLSDLALAWLDPRIRLE